jgi:hypothetical protein
MTIVAKPVIDKQFWILQENNCKIGNIEACAGGYQVKINNQIAQFRTIKLVAKQINIEFESPRQNLKSNIIKDHVHGYQATGRVYNPMWNVFQQLPVYTKSAKSKSWFAAGWYNVRKGRVWKTVLAPKLIVLQRYSYQGPFYSKSEANDHSSTTIC